MIMNLFLDEQKALGYKSPAQKARVLTEDWVDRHVFCPSCGHQSIDQHPNNEPVADFFCPNCLEDYELKSTKGAIGAKIVDGAYSTMLQRLLSSTSPHLFLLSYNLEHLKVSDFLIIPKHFFVPGIIEQRKPLAPSARRAGWVGCNILLNSIPKTGRIFFVKNGVAASRQRVLDDWQKTLFLKDAKSISQKGWLLDVMLCVEALEKEQFSLDEIYAFEGHLAGLHRQNRHIKDKIRQQLQVLRDRGYLEFVSRGRYRVV